MPASLLVFPWQPVLIAGMNILCDVPVNLTKPGAPLNPRTFKHRSRPLLLSSMGGRCLLAWLEAPRVASFCPYKPWLPLQSLFQPLAGLGFGFAGGCSGRRGVSYLLLLAAGGCSRAVASRRSL